jgi:DHA1 family bicyclomycin/chloramphenicol resistance-like MFS transporter
MGLPGIPAIESTFADAAGRGPLTLSLFLAGFAISPLVGGPLADRFGRRNVLLVGLALFSIAAAACALATSFGMLLVFRLLQGFSAGACVILPLAIVRDVFEGATARHRLSQVSAVLGIAPMVAPILGGWVMSVSGWREIYAAQCVTGIILLIVSALGFEETLPVGRRRSLNPGQLVGSYRMVLLDRTFVGFSIVYGLGFACMFSYISGSATVFMGTLGLTGTQFSLLFAVTSCGVFFGSLASGRLSKKHVSARKIMASGLAVMTLAALAGCLLVTLGIVEIYTLCPLIALIIFCFGLIAPSTNHEAMHNLGAVAGSAAGVIRSIQMLLGAIASALIAALNVFGNPPLAMTALMAGAILLSAIVYVMMMRAERTDRQTVAAE